MALLNFPSVAPIPRTLTSLFSTAMKEKIKNDFIYAMICNYLFAYKTEDLYSDADSR